MTILKCSVCKEPFECEPKDGQIPLMCFWCLRRLKKLVAS